MDSGQHCGSVQDLINLTQNLDCYDLHPGVDNEEMLAAFMWRIWKVSKCRTI